MITTTYDWTFRRVVWATLIFVFIALSFWLLYRFSQVIFICFIAIIIGTVIRPAVTWLYSHGIPRIAGVILVYLLLLALLISFVLLLFPLIIEQGTTIVAAVPGYYQNLRQWMINFPIQLIVRLSEYLPATLPSLAPVQQTGQQMLATARASVGLRDIGGSGHIYGHSYSSIGPSLDAPRPADHPIYVAACSKGSAREYW